MLTQREEQIVAILERLLKCPREALRVDVSWASQGIDSLYGLRLLGRLSELSGVELDPMLLLDCGSIRELAAHLDSEVEVGGSGKRS